MTDILAASHAGVLARLARSRALLAFDFDGTLAPIVRERDGAAMRARTERLLARLCTLYPCAVISGRGRADVAARLGAAPVPHVIGNHGLEPGADPAALARLARRARPLLADALRDWPGVEIEDKRLSLAVHYRGAARKRAARAAVERAVAALPVAMRVVPGRAVVNVVPAGAPDKGDALLALRARLGVEAALYVGDDGTDEDVFRRAAAAPLVAVRVGRGRTSAAAYFVRGQHQVDALLARLVALRAGEGR